MRRLNVICGKFEWSVIGILGVQGATEQLNFIVFYCYQRHKPKNMKQGQHSTNTGWMSVVNKPAHILSWSIIGGVFWCLHEITQRQYIISYSSFRPQTNAQQLSSDVAVVVPPPVCASGSASHLLQPSTSDLQNLTAAALIFLTKINRLQNGRRRKTLVITAGRHTLWLGVCACFYW